MTTRYKTQCPRCHTIYPMPDSKLGEQKARANCGKCHHTFFLNSHLIDTEEAEQDTPQATQTVAPSANPANEDSLELPKVPIRKKSKAVPAEGMIYDGMESDSDDGNADIEFSDDDLNKFLKQEITSDMPVTAATAKDSAQQGDDEAWIKDLLKSEDVNIPIAPVAHRPHDDLSELIDNDFHAMIPKVQDYEHPDVILKKINERLDNHAPTEEQKAKQRSPLINVFWGVGSALLLGLIGVQYTLFNADAIAKSGGDGGLLASVCSSCIPSADSSAFKTSYELQAGKADHTTNLIGTIKNTSGKDQLYPNIKIKVMGANGLLGDLALAPDEYLDFSQRLLTPTQDGRFMLTLDLPMDEIQSVHIEPFY